ncbi:DMT family transporter [Thermosulfurimonas dismutans]|uniref:Permeases of the drug/metabolite transporter (DMT) superfamily n=1 Tax=Thermosulfurimonas dismutans TaxID=999894 RepID=A0A179D193_9BACT|nr:DMT family transporter [Thermosulfurimonas dismutans]OAQ19827.1 Permeases of the drug/metabolite transporter (DMT) superfamily [Thermosulfurimonas dismutans]
MIWFTLALGAAFFVALGDALNKKFFARDGMVLMATARTLGPLPFLLFFLWIFFPTSELLSHFSKALQNPEFLKTVGLLLPLETLAILLYMEAIRISPLSLTLPFLSFTPTFIILTGYIVLGEKLSWKGIGGIGLVVLGSYLLHLPVLKEGPLTPFRALFRERGSLLMLAVALIYAVTTVFGKKAILLSDPLWFAGSYFVLLGLFVPAVLKLFFRPRILNFIKQNLKGVLLLGLTQALMIICHMKAISLAPAAYMIAVKRTSILFGILFGGAFFQESHLQARFFAASIMLLGVVLIVTG